VKVVNFADSEFARHFAHQWTGNWRRSNRLPTSDLADRLTTAVIDLADGNGPMSLDPFRKPRQSGHIPVIIGHKHPRHDAATRIDADVLGDDRPKSTGGTGFEIIDERLPDRPVRLGKMSGHRRNDHAVTEDNLTYPQRTEEMRECRCHI